MDKKLSMFPGRVSVIPVERGGFHLVDVSMWPAGMALNLMALATAVVGACKGIIEWSSVSYGMVGVLLTICVWLRDVVREGTMEGHHTLRVQRGLKVGMLLIIVSEVMFIVSIIGSYWYVAVGPIAEVGGVWPPMGLEEASKWGIPLLNTAILLCSGVSVTWAHHGTVVGKRSEVVGGLLVTVLLGIIITGVQGYEYVEGSLTISTGVYGSILYMVTGIHGMHVLVGTIMLGVCLVRCVGYGYAKEHHVGVEASIWYWHIVDVVWLGVILCLY